MKESSLQPVGVSLEPKTEVEVNCEPAAKEEGSLEPKTVEPEIDEMGSLEPETWKRWSLEPETVGGGQSQAGNCKEEKRREVGCDACWLTSCS